MDTETGFIYSKVLKYKFAKKQLSPDSKVFHLLLMKYINVNKINTNANIQNYVSHIIYSVSQKQNHPPATWGFLTFFHKRLRILNQFFTHLLYARIQIFIQLSQTLTKLCHIKRDYLVQNIFYMVETKL